jgi:hypothetical protein
MKRLLLLVCIFLYGLFFLISSKKDLHKSDDINHENPEVTGEIIWKKQIEEKARRRKNGHHKMDQPDLYQKFHAEIRKKEGEESSGYPMNYRVRALNKIKTESQNARITSNGVLEYIPRGPANVPGRTRGLLVLPGDEGNNTWLAGSAGGGIWKTTDAGQSWRFLTPDFPTMAVSTLANSEVAPNIIYAGTGEYIASAGTAIDGQGIFKSTDGGENWVQLPSTTNTVNFLNIMRIIVDPQNPDLLLACSSPNNWRARPDEFISTIMRSEDGGISWTKVYEVTVQDIQNEEATGAIDQIIATPGNFNILYATMHGFGPLKSTDAGLTWQKSNFGMAAYGRVELAISPVKPDRLFASAEGSLSGTDSNSDLYISDNAGESWSFLSTEFNDLPVDFLGGQGWYNNTIACDPYNADIIYVGGVSLFRFKLSASQRNSYIVQQENLNFLDLVDFGAEYNGGTLEANESAGEFSVEVRFGPGETQRAHRYLVPEDATSGVPPEEYYYQDYVDVPFEVWDISTNRQLMVGFRDQDRNGEFNLKPLNTDSLTDPLEQSREYIYIAGIPYDPAEPDTNMAITGGHEYRNMFFFWPVLADGATWDPNNLPQSALSIIYNGKEPTGTTTRVVADAYGEFDGNNRYLALGDVHPDQHNMIMIPVNETQETYKILLSNDGGVFLSNISTEPGINEGDWTFAGNGYITTQFYGAEKMPGEERFLGGTQDNGTWHSPPGTEASNITNYRFAIGGDGFEVLWHALDPSKMIGGSQFNRFRRSLNGGRSWVAAASGITGNSPFISKLSSSDDLPEVIYTVSSSGVFRSPDFGGSWNLTPITEKWLSDVSSTFLDVEVSRANANIIWAGSGMSSTRNIHYSVDGGKTFNISNNYTESNLGTFTRLGSHPLEDSTAYALFSFSKSPKVLRTTDLGQSWQDISGFNVNETSSTGFPDVAVYCIYVRPDNPDIIWVGSEIGIIESLNNGQSWHLLQDFPNASVWDIKGRDSLITIATHGRGIWTAKVAAEQRIVERPIINDVARMPNGKVIVALEFKEDFDSTAFFIDNVYTGSIQNSGEARDTIIISGIMKNSFDLSPVAYIGTAPYANLFQARVKNQRDPIQSFFTTFSKREGNISSSSYVRQPITPESKNFSFHSPHNYPDNADISFSIDPPVIVSAENPFLNYEDVAIVQPGQDNDYVVVEGTIDGLNWTALTPPYDAGFNPEWEAIFNSGENPAAENFVAHQIDLTNTFNAGDTVAIRFRLHSDEQINGWGWAVDNIFLQTPVVAVDKELSAEQISLYPNPASDDFTVEFANPEQKYISFSIIDITGKLWLNSNTTTTEGKVDVSHLRNGTYLLVITKDGNKHVKKFIVKH